MDGPECDRLENEFNLHLPSDYRNMLLSADSLPWQIESNLESLRELNVLWREKPPLRFDWQPNFWCIGCAGIPGHRAGQYYFIDCDDEVTVVSVLSQDDPAWSLLDDRRLERFSFVDFVSELTSASERATHARLDRIDQAKRTKRLTLWQRLFGQRPPRLGTAPEWMVSALCRRTGVDIAESRRMLNAANSAEAWTAVVCPNPDEFRRMMAEDAFYEQMASAWLVRDPIEFDDRFASVLLRAHLEVERDVMSMEGHTHGFQYLRLVKEALKTRYKVNWRTPIELNPDKEIS